MTSIDLSQLHLHWRTSRYKGNVYRSYSLARPFRSDGKNRKEIVLPLGKLTDEQAAMWRAVLKAIKTPGSFFATLDDIVVTHHFAYLDVAVANAVWEYWQLDKVLRDDGPRDLPLATVTRILALNRCIEPAAKSQAPEWFRSTALPWLLDVDSNHVNASRIFRELNAIERHKNAICKHLFDTMHKQDPNSMNSVFYDLSSSTFTGTRCVLMKWGHCKEGYRSHVVLALVVNRDGLPFYWEVLPGGTADAKTIPWVLQRMKEHFNVSNITLVFDRGMVSDDNLTLLEDAKIKYISAMDKSQLETITGIDFTKFSYLDPEHVQEQAAELPDFDKLNDDTYYREVKVDGDRRYILCFNPQLFKDQRKARHQAVEDFRSFVEALNDELRAAKKSRQRKATYEKFRCQLVKKKLKDFVHVTLRVIHIKENESGKAKGAIRSYRGTVVVDEDAMLRAAKRDGFWLLVTNHSEKQGDRFNVSTQDAILPYREKVVIEAAFRDIKSFVDVSPVFVWKPVHVKAHYTVCVLSHLINRTITLRLHKNVGRQTTNVVSHEKLYKELSACQIDRIEIDNVHISTYNMTRPTADQAELLHRVGLPNLFLREIVHKARRSS